MNILYFIIALILLLILGKYILGTLIGFTFLIIFTAGIYFLGKKVFQQLFK